MANKAKNTKTKTATPSKGVKFVFAGEYYTGAKNDGSQIKPYTLDVVFPEYTPKALSLFKTGLKKPENAIRKLMIAKYPDFRTVRTHTIMGITDLSGKVRNTSNVSIMTIEQLERYIEDNELGINVEVYADNITRLREAIIQAENDPEAFKESYKADLEAYEFNKQLTDLNGSESNSNVENKNEGEEESDTDEGKSDIDNLLGDMEEESDTDEG